MARNGPYVEGWKEMGKVGGRLKPGVKTFPLITEMQRRRLELCISQRALAIKAGVSVNLITLWEANLGLPTLGLFESAIQTLGGKLVIVWGDEPPGGK